MLCPAVQCPLRSLQLLLSATVTLGCLAFPVVASAADRYWVGSPGGNWEDTANWSASANACGASGGASVPGTSDIARFVSNCVSDASVNVNVSVAGISIASGYDGTISQMAGRTVTVGNSGYFQAGGTFAATENLAVSGDFARSGGVFLAGAGLVRFYGNAAAYDVTVEHAFHEIWIFKMNANCLTITSGQIMRVQGDVMLRQGCINTGTLDAYADIAQDDTYGGLYATGLIRFANEHAVQTYTIAGGTAPHLLFDAAHQASDAVVLTANSVVNGLTIAGTFSGTVPFSYSGYSLGIGERGFLQETGTFYAPAILNLGAGNIYTQSSFTRTGGVFDAGSGRVNFWGDISTYHVTAPHAFHDVEMNKRDGACVTISAGHIMQVQGDLSLVRGCFNTGSVDARSDVTQAATFGRSNASGVLFLGNSDRDQTFTIYGGMAPRLLFDAPHQATDAVVFHADTLIVGLAINSTFSGTVPFIYNGERTITINGYHFYHAGGTFSAPSTMIMGTSGTVGYGSNFTRTGGVFDPGGGLIRFIASYSSSYNVTVPHAFWNVEMNKVGSAALTIPSSQTMQVDGALNLVRGRVNTGTLSAAGNVTVQSTFGGGTARLRFSGSADQTYADAGGTVLVGDVTVNKDGGILTLDTGAFWNAAGQDLTVTSGTIDFNGKTVALGGNLTMGPGAQIVADADAMNGATITVGGNLDLDGEDGDKLIFRWTDAWSLNVTGNATFDFVSLATTGTTHMTLAVGGTAIATNTDVTYSDASGGMQIDATDPTNTDNDSNVNWLFGAGDSGGDPVPFFPWWTIPIALLGGGWMLRRESAA